MDGEVAGFNIKKSTSTEAQHLLRVKIPGYAISIRFLIDELFAGNIIDLERV